MVHIWYQGLVSKELVRVAPQKIALLLPLQRHRVKLGGKILTGEPRQEASSHS